MLGVFKVKMFERRLFVYASGWLCSDITNSNTLIKAARLKAEFASRNSFSYAKKL